MKAIWIGGIFSETALSRYRAVNQAQNRWSLGLVCKLKQRGWSFYSLAFRAEQLWPKGSIRPGKLVDFHSEVDPLLVQTWNLPIFRKRHLPGAYLQRLKVHFREQGEPDCVITYNPLDYHVPAAEWAVAKGVPWISITLDMKYPGERMEHFSRLNRMATGQVILSWWGYENCPLEPKLHLDGGYESLESDYADYSDNAKKIILYAGKYTNYGGDNLLADTIQTCKREDVEFWLLGKGENRRIEALAQTDSRVKRFGFVSNSDLIKLCKKAHIFLNPRPNAYADNTMAFPSKLLFYMAFGKPLISTWTPGLSPEYRPHLEIPTEETGGSLSESIDRALNKTAKERQKLRQNMFDFLVASRSWSIQADRFDRFARNCISR